MTNYNTYVTNCLKNDKTCNQQECIGNCSVLMR